MAKNSWGFDPVHPHAKYGSIIDYNGMQQGGSVGKFRGPASTEEAQQLELRQAERSKRHHEFMRQREEERAENLVKLRLVAVVCQMLSWCLSGISEEELEDRLRDYRQAGMVVGGFCVDKKQPATA